jgi:hypothetical protein
MEIKIAKTDAEVELASEIMQQLRASYSIEDLIAAIKNQRRSGYQIAYAAVDAKPRLALSLNCSKPRAQLR